MVYRVYVEKKEALANEARALLEDLRAFLGIQSLTGLRLFNRYDLEGISRELFDYAVQTVLSEPQLDTVTSEVPQGDTVFAVEYLPGQYDQRADSAAQCIQILSQGERPTVRTARVYVLEGELTAEQVEKVIDLLLNNDKVLDFTSPIPQGTKLLSCKVSGGEAVVNFSSNYGRLSGFDLTVANYCITLSASQIPGVRRIHILIDGESLSGRDDALSTGDVLLTSSEDVVKAVPVVLYFPDSTGELQPEKRELLIYEGENHGQRVLEALSEGPNTEGLYALVPEGIHIAGVWMDGDICCLNFSLTDYRALCESTVDQGMLVEGLVKSLCSLKGVERVQFMVNGAYRTRLGVVDIENPIRP